MSQFHIHNLYINLIFKAQINLMQFLKKIKSEWNFNCCYFWYYTYFYFWHKVFKPYHGNTQSYLLYLLGHLMIPKSSWNLIQEKHKNLSLKYLQNQTFGTLTYLSVVSNYHLPIQPKFTAHTSSNSLDWKLECKYEIHCKLSYPNLKILWCLITLVPGEIEDLQWKSTYM